MAHRFPPQPVPSPRSFYTIKPVLELTEVINSGPAVYTQWKKDMEYRENVTRNCLTVAFALERNFFIYSGGADSIFLFHLFAR